MDWACCKFGVVERTIQGFGRGNLKERGYLEDVWLFADYIVDIGNVCWKCLTCLDVAQDWTGRRAVVNGVMNFVFHKVRRFC
jgi:hypothetical protein